MFSRVLGIVYFFQTDTVSFQHLRSLSLVLFYFLLFGRNELYSKRRDRFEEECKKQLVGNIVLTRLVTLLFRSVCVFISVWRYIVASVDELVYLGIEMC